ncbi:MAG: hypothetical protein ACMXX6_00505 [Candidatus Woesearchaeota archaeon]
MSYFFRIENPQDFRRNLLQGSRDVILLLKSESQIDDIINKKKVLTRELKDLMSEINFLCAKANDIILDTDLKLEFAAGINYTEPSKIELKEPQEAQISSKPVTELDRLEYTLGKIEEKLQRL